MKKQSKILVNKNESAKASHSGVMVALMVPPAIADSIAIEGGEPADELHVTIAYLPGISGDEDKLIALQEALSPLSSTLAPITGKIGGIGRFQASKNSDGKDVYYASFNSPGLESLRRAVLNAIDSAGLEVSNAHGFTPHITLKYLDPKEETPENMSGTLPFAIDKLTIGDCDEYTDFQMIGTVVLKASPTGSSVHVNTPISTKISTKLKKETVLEGGGLDGVESGSNAMDGIYSMAQIVSGIDWELGDGGLSDVDDAKELALNNLSDDPDFYRKKYLIAANSPDVAMKDTEQQDIDPDLGVGINLDLGSGQARQQGSLGIDLYPFDHGTIVHDLDLGLPFIDDETVQNVRLSNVPEVDPENLMSEIQRVLMPGGTFSYDGPTEIQGIPPYMEERHKETIDKDAEGGPWTKQTLGRIAVPDAATSNDAEPRIGIAQYDMLPADALLAMDATGYYNSDGTSSGRGNRVHGYPSQGALLNKRQLPGVRNLGTDNTGAVSKRICPIFKADSWKQVIYCVVLSPDETDLQDDIMTADEIEKTAHDYLLEARVVGAGHSRKMDAGVVESYIAPQDFNADGQYGPQLVKKGAWVIGIKVDDPREWQKVLNGEYTGVSVGGVGTRIPI